MEDEFIAVEAVASPEADSPLVSESDEALVTKLMAEINADKAHFEKAFKTMRDDMQLATYGHADSWGDENYSANIIGRHVKQKTAALYAKNPKIVAKRRETLDFAQWDGNPDSLALAQQTLQLAAQAGQPELDPATGLPTIDPLTGAPILTPGPSPEEVMLAQATMADFQQGMAKRREMDKWGKTLEVLFNHSMREQKPLDFKMGMKRLVRRACTTGVGYVKLAFAREMGPSPVTSARIDDANTRLAHLTRLLEDAQDGEIEEISAEMAELQLALQALQSEELIVVREGLIFDYPQSTRVIPDRSTMSLVGFVGARHLTLEYLYTVDEVREQFPDAHIEYGFTPFRSNWNGEDDGSEPAAMSNSKGETKMPGGAMVKVFEHFDKPSGLVYYMAEGYKGFLRPPGPPDVFVEDFWPVYALTFNDVENEKALFPPSDARLMKHQQDEINRSRQGQREHRNAARPRFVSGTGAIDDEGKGKLATAQPFDVITLNLAQGQSISDLLQTVPVPGVDPNLYETSPFFQDMQLVVGSQQAVLGGIAKATATESAIAANSMAASDGSAVDDLDNFLTMVARGGGQILQREMSPEQVMVICGPGAVWPDLTLDQIASELYLDIEAGSTGKPNQAVEINNWQQMLPMLLQMPGLSPQWLLKETLRRLDDRMDTVDAIADGIPSIAMQNQMAQPNMISAAGPQADPSAQGGQGAAGASNVPAGPSMTPGGSSAAFGSNQV